MARHTILVVPGKPDESFLVDKVQATDLNADTEGANMPLNMPQLDSTELDAIHTWIQNGANNDSYYQANVAPIFGDGVSLGNKAGKCSYCHSAQSLNPPNLADPFDPVRGVVNVTALVGGTRVIPGDPEHSVLYQKVAGAPLPPSLKSPMPYQTAKLTTDEIAAIVAWIADGARNN
jgi:mono/diheme cytochrome c family protein